MTEYVTIEKGHGPEGRIAIVRFDRGDGIDALSPEAMRQLTNAARSFEDDASTSVVVLTGGSAKMEGAVELAEEVFHMPVRLGLPQQVTDLADVVRNPIHATGVGLLRYGAQQLADRSALLQQPAQPSGGRVQQDPSEQAAQAGNKSGFWSWFRAAF